MTQLRNGGRPRQRNEPEARPFTARSVLASTLLGVTPPRLPTLLLVRSGELFGFSEGAIRTAISRMTAAGELVSDGTGYRLAGRLLDRHARQRASRSAKPLRWKGEWDMAVVTTDRRTAAERSALRDAMRRLKLAEWREGVWMRPANLDSDRSPDARAIVDDQCRWVSGRPADNPTTLAAQLWDLPSWKRSATVLARRIGGLVGPLEAGDTSALADGFVVSAEVLRHLLADPELPPDLLPANWPGGRLRSDYDRYDLAYKAVWRDWFSDQR